MILLVDIYVLYCSGRIGVIKSWYMWFLFLNIIQFSCGGGSFIMLFCVVGRIMDIGLEDMDFSFDFCMFVGNFLNRVDVQFLYLERNRNRCFFCFIG